jgi:hypothetical protein
MPGEINQHDRGKLQAAPALFSEFVDRPACDMDVMKITAGRYQLQHLNNFENFISELNDFPF